MPKPSAGRSTPPSDCEQVVVAPAAADRAQLALARRTARRRCPCSTPVRARSRDRSCTHSQHAERLRGSRSSAAARRRTASRCGAPANSRSICVERHGADAARTASRSRRRRHAGRGQLLARHVARMAIELVEHAEHGGRLLVGDAERRAGSRCSSRRSDTRARTSLDVSPQVAHDLDRDREQLGVGGHVRLRR